MEVKDKMKYIRLVRETGERIEPSRAGALKFIEAFYRDPHSLLDQLIDGEIDLMAGPASNLIIER